MKRRICKTRQELISVLLERQDELNISAATVDAIAGLPDRYTGKVLSFTPIKNLGPTSLSAILGALGLGIVRIEIAEDPQAAALVAGRWVPRRTPHRRKKKPPESGQWCVVEQKQPEFNFGNTEAEMKMIGVRIDPELEARLKVAADKDRRKLSQFVRNVLNDALDKPAQPEGPKLEIVS